MRVVKKYKMQNTEFFSWQTKYFGLKFLVFVLQELNNDYSDTVFMANDSPEPHSIRLVTENMHAKWKIKDNS